MDQIRRVRHDLSGVKLSLETAFKLLLESQDSVANEVHAEACELHRLGIERLTEAMKTLSQISSETKSS